MAACIRTSGTGKGNIQAFRERRSLARALVDSFTILHLSVYFTSGGIIFLHWQYFVTIELYRHLLEVGSMALSRLVFMQNLSGLTKKKKKKYPQSHTVTPFWFYLKI